MENEKRLTEADKIAYHTIEKFIEENGYPPSVRDLCRIMGKSSTATIQYRLKSLKQKGYINTTDKGKRTIRITKKIDEAPTVEVVEIVRCKDCKHWNTNGCGDGCGWCESWEQGRFHDGFCNYGERKDNG